MNRKKIVIVLIAVSIVLIAPPFVFISFFWNKPVSNDIHDWGVLGDYIGGVLNPIISLLNLVILGYLTYLVSQQSNEQNRKLILLEKKMEAYQDLTRHVKEINMVSTRIVKSTSLLNLVSKLPAAQQIDPLMQMMREMVEIAGTFKEFYYTLFTFNLKYGYLFKYDFKSKDFEELKKEVNLASQRFDTIVQNYTEASEYKVKNEDLTPSKRLLELLVNVINEIREEISS